MKTNGGLKTRPTKRNKKEADVFTSASFLVLAQYSYVAGLRTFRTLFNSELDLLSFLQVLVTIALNSGEMNENVLSAFAFDEAEAFCSIEPLYCTDNSFRHVLPPMAIKFFIPMRALHTHAGIIGQSVRSIGGKTKPPTVKP